MSGSINLIQQRKQDLENAFTAQAPQKPPIDTGSELHVKGLREIVGEKLKSRKELEKPAGNEASTETKQATISLQNKVVSIKYIGTNGTDVEDEITLNTTHWFIAAIMNLFAKIFPRCVQGAAKFLINDKTCYVRRTLIQEKLHIAVKRGEFTEEPQANTLKLKVLSFEHFTSEDPQAAV
jgi:hypothetical protein